MPSPTASFGRRRRGLVAAVIAGALLAPLPLSVSYADQPRPGGEASQAKADAADKARQLKAAQQQAQTDKQRLAAAQSAVASAQQQLTDMAAAARVAIHDYKVAMVRLRHARAEAEAARVALVAAAEHVAEMQRQVDAFVRASYMSGGPLAAVAAVLSAGGPSSILDQASLLGAVSRSQDRMLLELNVAEEQQALLTDAANAAMAKVAKITARADAARRAAMVAMANQHALIGELTSQQVSVAKQLAAHESQVANLTRERAAAEARAQVAAQRAALAAAWDAMQAAGEAMPWATARQGRRALAWAKKQLGVPYSWGGGDTKGPTLGAVNEEGNASGLHTVGFDCSGLTLYAWAHAGFRLDHYTGYQWVEGHHIGLDKLRAGDLVFFASDTSDPLTIHHVGIYVDGNRMIDAPHTGAVVRYDTVFKPGLIGAVRP